MSFVLTAIVFILGSVLGFGFALGLILLVLLAMGNDQIDRTRDEISEE